MNDKMKKIAFSWRAAIQKSDLKPTTRFVLLNLSCHMNEQGESCHPSIEHQADSTGLSKRAIIEHIQLAVDAGFLVRQYVHPSTSQWKYSEYRACFPKDYSLPTAEDFQSNVGDPPSPRQNTNVGDPNDTILVTEGNSNSSLNTSPKEVSKKVRKNIYTKKQMTLQQWEDSPEIGCNLNYSMFSNWVREKGYCPVLVSQLIDEFRIDMISKGKAYADFRAAFQTYLTKDFLSKTSIQTLLVNSPHKSVDHTTINRRGGSI